MTAIFKDVQHKMNFDGFTAESYGFDYRFDEEVNYCSILNVVLLHDLLNLKSLNYCKLITTP